MKERTGTELTKWIEGIEDNEGIYKYEDVKHNYPKIAEEVNFAKTNNLPENETLFKNAVVTHSRNMDLEYGNSDSPERKVKEEYFDEFVSKVCGWINKHTKVSLAIKVGFTAAAAVCAAAATAFPPAAVGALVFGAVAGAVEVATNIADKKNLEEMKLKVENLTTEARRPNELKSLNNLEAQINKESEGGNYKKLETEMKNRLTPQALSFTDAEALKHLPPTITKAMEQTNNKYITNGKTALAEGAKNTALAEGAKRQNQQIAALKKHTH